MGWLDGRAGTTGNRESCLDVGGLGNILGMVYDLGQTSASARSGTFIIQIMKQAYFGFCSHCAAYISLPCSRAHYK